MNKPSAHCSKAGFHLIELLLILLVLVIMAAIIVPAFAKPKAKSQRIQCASNLKQVATAFCQWSAAHEGQFPTQLSATKGGVTEAVPTGDVASMFRVVSNELGTPRILFCPTDKHRIQAETFSLTAAAKGRNNGIPFLSSTNVSYFVGFDVCTNLPATILAGDDNLLIGGTNRFPGWPPPPGILSLTTNDSILWSSDRHAYAGNVVLADGSVEFVSSLGLMRLLEAPGLATNRLAMP